MLILHGLYNFAPKRVAYRNDYCLSCQAPRRAVRVRTFDVLHIMFMPILPVGLWKRWHCGECGCDPHAPTKTRKSFQWLGVFVLIMMSAAGWAVEVDPNDYFLDWGMRIGFPALLVYAIWYAVRSEPEVRLSDQLKSVVPANETECPFCGAPFVLDKGWRCVNCGVERVVLRS
jgi:hypothetical protein